MAREIVVVQGREVRVGNTSDWRGLLATYIAQLDVKQSSREAYKRALIQYFRWIEETGRRLSELTRTDILQYKDDLLSKGISNLTVGSYLTIVRKLYEWAEGEKLYQNIAKGIKNPKRKQEFIKQHLTVDKVEELLEYYRHKNKPTVRDYAIVSTLLRTGIRTVELTRLDIGDITFMRNRRVIKVWGKGHDTKDSFVVLSDKAYKALAEYIQAERKGAKPNEPLFASFSNRNSGGRLTTRTVSKVAKEGLIAIGLEGKEFTAHSLRHTTAVAILKNGGNITDVQSILRHTNPATSQIYTESIKNEMRLDNAPELMLDDVF